ncbi:MAG TPA: DUF3443 domain-containing protein [Nitrospira sp.]|nr:DUF3443 domain-containing protein [Nitrospira sp.]
MKYLAVACAFIFLTSGCGGGGDSGGGAGSAPANVLTVSVGASTLCRNVNELCAQVTICSPGTSSCQTIPDILVDIGSFGLRIFGSVLLPSLVQEVDSQNNPIGECAFFADGTTFWGPVQRADVVLGGEPAVNVPIHVIDPTFAGQSTSQNPCNSVVESNPQDVFFNGILGIGVFAQDCGPVCATQSNNTLYFSCVGSTCAGTAVPLLNQVQNPVSLLPSDNNGVTLTLPSVPSTGAQSVSGSLILGIGTAVNNTPPGGVSVFTTDPTTGLFKTIYNGTNFGQAVIDSGSNGYFFPDQTIPVCTAPLQDFYCPVSQADLLATLVGANSHQAIIPFQVANTSSLVQTGHAVFNNLGGPSPSFFVWGLPFFLGRTVYVGFDSQPSTLGTGPFLAF